MSVMSGILHYCLRACTHRKEQSSSLAHTALSISGACHVFAQYFYSNVITLETTVGFMGTGACILDKESDMPCGLIIEKVNGYAVEKRLTKDETFADARYILEMCRQVGVFTCVIVVSSHL